MPWFYSFLGDCGPDDKQLERAHAYCQKTLGGQLLENRYPINSHNRKGTEYGFDYSSLKDTVGIESLLPIINLKKNASNVVIDYDSDYRYPGEQPLYSDKGKYDYKKLDQLTNV
jgi:hypothetical protein